MIRNFSACLYLHSNCRLTRENSKLQDCLKNIKDSDTKPLFSESFGIDWEVGLVFTTFIVMGYSMGLTFHFYTIGNCRTEIAKIQYHVCLHFFGRECITTGTPLPLRICTFQIANIVKKFYSKFTIQWLKIAKTKLLNYHVSHAKLQVV